VDLLILTVTPFSYKRLCVNKMQHFIYLYLRKKIYYNITLPSFSALRLWLLTVLRLRSATAGRRGFLV
jgi:hypothetical protein